MEITIGENIRRLRIERRMTQEKLAEILNVTNAAVSKWERGDSLPDITMLFPIADYFGVSVDSLMGHKDKVNKN